MRWNDRSQLAGKHAYLSASSSAWLNYSDEKFERVFLAKLASQKGTELHDLAQRMINLGVKLEDLPKTLNMYVNDCIGFRMKTEITLYHSPFAFGTADAVSFRQNKLRIFDLKTGVQPVGVRQLEVYAAYFCLEYDFRPFDIEIELRIYQNDDVKIYEADPVEISLIMEKIKQFSDHIIKMREEME